MACLLTSGRALPCKSSVGGLKAKLSNKEAKKSYNARNGCSEGRHNDKCKAGYWSCRLPRYAKKLGLSGGGTWW